MNSLKQHKIFCITNLLHLEIPQDLGKGFEVYPNMYITNNKHFLSRLISKNLRESIGELETNALKNSSAVLYSLEHMDQSEVLTTASDMLLQFLYIARFLITTSWLIKDNSIKFEMGFIEVPHKAEPSIVSSTFLSGSPVNRKGNDEFIIFSLVELGQLRDMFQEYFVSFLVRGSAQAKLDEVNRLQRAIYFLQAARFNSDLGLKISFYCTCLESLFSTDTTELTHKLSERVAFFMGDTPSNRLRIYSEIRNAYRIRSTVIHGDRISSKKTNMVEAAVESCDTILRNILNKILSSATLRTQFISNNDKLEQFFLELIFGVQTS